MQTTRKTLNATIGVLAFAMVAFFTVDTVQAYRGGPGYGPGSKYHQGRRGGPGLGHMGHLNRMQYRLGLSDSQVKKIFNIHSEYREKFFANRRNGVKLEALHKEMLTKIRNVLTKEQKQRWDDRSYRKNGRRCPGYGRRGVR